MALDRRLAEAAAEFARRRAAEFGKTFKDGADEILPDEPSYASPALPTAVHLVYEGARGAESERVVTLLAAWRTHGVLYFKGRCHLRKAFRTFRADHVVELICLATGEVAGDPPAWIQEHALYEGERESDFTPHALRLCRDELALLAYVGSADGSFDEAEVEVAIDYVMMSTEKEIDREKAGRYIRRLNPSVADIEAHLSWLSNHPDKWSRLTRAMRRLVDADRTISMEEQVTWTEIAEEYAALQAERQKDDLVGLLSSGLTAVGVELSHPAVRNMISAAISSAPRT